MSQHGSNRRDFLKMAGLSAGGLGMHQPARHGVEPAWKGDAPADAGTPFSSLSEIFSAPRSTCFGVKVEEREEPFGNGQSGRRLKLVPRDPRTLYRADGLSGEEEPHSFQLTFEITNNSILCSANQGGLLKHPCIFSRMVPARRRGKDLTSEELVGGSAWGFGVIQGGRPIRLPMTHGAQVELLGSVFPHVYRRTFTGFASVIAASDDAFWKAEMPTALLRLGMTAKRHLPRWLRSWVSARRTIPL
jgi:hypothetical protein